MNRWPAYDLDDSEEAINLTPLLDVLFVVLILFILAAPLLQMDKVALAPGSQEKESFTEVSGKNINISLSKSGSISIQKREIPAHLLDATCKALKERFPSHTPIVYIDKEAHFESYQLLKNALERANFHEMDVILTAR